MVIIIKFKNSYYLKLKIKKLINTNSLNYIYFPVN